MKPVRDQVDGHIFNPVWGWLCNNINWDIFIQVHQVRDQVQDQVKHQVGDQIENQMSANLANKEK